MYLNIPLIEVKNLSQSYTVIAKNAVTASFLA